MGQGKRGPPSWRSVCVRLETVVPPGCKLTVELNGERNVLKPGCTRRKGSVVQMQTAERRFGLAPRAAEPEPEGGGEPEPEEAEEDTAAPHAGLAEGAPTGASGGPAAFSAVIALDGCEVQARTAQELQVPDLDVVEVLDAAVVVRMRLLTGERFELTVYAATPPSEAEGAGAVAAFVRRGPVRSSELVQRIDQLESAQVYVCWVRVFCDDKSLESAQKGFRTLPARVRTIWDEPDHVILGVGTMATIKEITKAWRLKSLQHHPDKETDPEKKDAAEEMMKRLNLAKQNMLRSAPLDDSFGGTPMDTPDGHHPRPDSFGTAGGARRRSSSSASSSSSDARSSEEDGMARTPTPKSPTGATGSNEPGAPLESRVERDGGEASGGLRCSLRVEAPRAPKLRVVSRDLTSLDVEASNLSLGSTVEVQRFLDGEWLSVARAERAAVPCMRFTIGDLQENSSYKLRLRTTLVVEPLRLLFAEFAAAAPKREEGAGELPGGEGQDEGGVREHGASDRAPEEGRDSDGEEEEEPDWDAGEDLNEAPPYDYDG